MNLINHHKFEIETAPTTFSLIAKGILNAEANPNEVISQDNYLSGNGWGSTDVTGGQLIISFSGHRDYEDDAQNFIMGKMLTLGDNRKTNFKWTEPDGGLFEGEITIANISAPSGDAGNKADISFEVHFNGEPEYTPPTSG